MATYNKIETVNQSVSKNKNNALLQYSSNGNMTRKKSTQILSANKLTKTECVTKENIDYVDFEDHATERDNITNPCEIHNASKIDRFT